MGARQNVPRRFKPVFREDGLQSCNRVPFTRNMVSLQAGMSFVASNHSSAQSAPPQNPVVPSTISNLRCVRLLILGQECHRAGLYQATQAPADLSSRK